MADIALPDQFGDLIQRLQNDFNILAFIQVLLPAR
jgi:hypothetical protein